MKVHLQCCVFFLAISTSASVRELRKRRLHIPRTFEDLVWESDHSFAGVNFRQPGRSVAGKSENIRQLERDFKKQEEEVEEEQEDVFELAEPVRDIDTDDVERAIREGDDSFWDIVWHRMIQDQQALKKLPAAMRDWFDANAALLELLLPGLKARTSSLIGLPIIVCIGVLWITMYFGYFYILDHEEFLIRTTPDQSEQVQSADYDSRGSWALRRRRMPDSSFVHYSNWESSKSALDLEQKEETTNVLHCHADMVFVFHHPAHDYADSEKRITGEMLRRVIAHRKDTGFFAEFERVLEEHEKSMRATSNAGRIKGSISSAVGLEVLEMTMRQARVLMLKDMVRSLPQLGFEVSLFSSIDDDELFLCVSLNREEVIDHYLQREGVELQTTHAVIESLRIRQDPRDPNSSPPFLRYDKRMASALYKAKVIEQDDQQLLYRSYHDRNAQGSLISSRERIRVIQRELMRFLNLEAARECGVVVDWYPTHSELWLKRLQSTWSSWDNVKDWSFKQPIPLLREYFGSQMAFSFAWQGAWTKGLLCLSVIAVMIMVCKAIPSFGMMTGSSETFIPEKQIMPFSIITLIWARVVTNLWCREEEFFLALWNQEAGITDQIVRPSFKGRLCKADVDENIMEETIPRFEKITRKVGSVSITIICCIFAMVATGAWVHIHQGDLDLISSLWLSAMVKILEFVYNVISVHLVEFENHKFDQDFHDSWVWQQFSFQAVNNYWACIAIALSQKLSGKCPDGGCFVGLQFQLGMLLTILLGCSIVFSLLERLQVWVNVKSEDWYLKKEHNEERSFLEEQSKFADYNMRAQVENMLQLIIGLGFVLLFGTLQPLVAPLCFIHFVFALRTRAILLTAHTRRPLPHKLVGVGAWKSVMNTLMNLSVFVSGVFIVYWGRFFKGGLLLAKLSGLIIWLTLIFSLWSLVDIIVPRESSDTYTMTRRRAYAVRVITEAAMDAQVAAEDPIDTVELTTINRKSPDKPASSASLVFTDVLSHRAVHLVLGCNIKELVPQMDLVSNEKWESIPRLSGMLPGGGITRSLKVPLEEDDRSDV